MSFDDYQVLGPLGREGSGLWLAWRDRPISARGHYAVYEVEPGKAGDPDLQDRMLRAAYVGRMIEHETVVRIHEVLIEPDRAAVVADYVEGVDLDRVLARREAGHDPVPMAVSLELVARVLDAAYAIHCVVDEQGRACYHGRIAPSKVMVTADGGVKLGGFGVAADRAERRGPERLGAAADQFAAGLLLLDLVLGRRLALDESLQPSAGRWSRTLRRAVRDLDMASPTAPVVLRMLAMQAGDRYSDCAAAAGELRRVHASLGGGQRLPLFAMEEVTAVRADEPDTTEPNEATDSLRVPSSEWIEDLDEEDCEELMETLVDGPLLRSSTVPFSPTFMPKAAWYHEEPSPPMERSAPSRSVLSAAMETTAGYTGQRVQRSALPFDPSRSVDDLSLSAIPALYGSDPHGAALGAAQSSEDSTWQTRPQDTIGTMPFAATYAPQGAWTRSVPAWVLAGETEPIPVQERARGKGPRPSLTFDSTPAGTLPPPRASANLSLPGADVRKRRRRRRRAERRGGSGLSSRTRARLRTEVRRRPSQPGRGVASSANPRRRRPVRPGQGDGAAISTFGRVWRLEGALESSTALQALVAFVLICLLIVLTHVYKQRFFPSEPPPDELSQVEIPLVD